MKRDILNLRLLVLFLTTISLYVSANDITDESHDSEIVFDSDKSRYFDSINKFDPNTDLPINPDIPPFVIENDVKYADPDNPGIPVVSNNNSVGLSDGVFSVSESGAAEYTMSIHCPDGGRLTPQIALTYSSQNMGYGVAGYGFGITGISAITRGEKNLFNNGGDLQGVTYDKNDNLFLDGKRLILQSGDPLQEGAIYCLQGDPYTIITAHGTYDNTTANTWFEVKTTDGKTYYYGYGDNTTISFKDRSGSTRIASWYVNKIEDVYGNYITYSYTVKNHYAYPYCIIYGLNSKVDRGIINKIQFDYAPASSASIFNVADQKGKIDQCLSSITTTCNNTVFRKYKFSYDNNSDLSATRFSRLTTIQEENGKGERRNPVQFNWSHLPDGSATSSLINVSTDNGSTLVEETDKAFSAADLNGDGISDIIRLAPVKVIEAIGGGHTSWHNETKVYISRSQVSESGNISYKEPIEFTIPPSFSTDKLKNAIGTTALMDLDGDGYNDIIIPYHSQIGTDNQERFYVIFGHDVAEGTGKTVQGFTINLKSAKENPLYVTFDSDGDGRDDIVSIEQTKLNGAYPARIIKMKSDSKLESQDFSLTLTSDPEKLFSADYNNDGLTDIIVFYKEGYKIFFNSGGKESSVKFSDANSKSGLWPSKLWRIQQGDFDGDGLVDFVYYLTGESILHIARNNGNGTFSYSVSDNIGISNNSTSKDDDRFSIVVYDADCDGKSDVVLCKAEYSGDKYSKTHIKWMSSDGNSLKLKKSIVKSRQDDANENHILLGDFDGDGHMELANYGSNLNSTDDTFTANRIYIYKKAGKLAKAGKLTSIINSMGSRTDIEYASATDPTVCARTSKATNNYPLNTYSLPLTVVKSVTSGNGVAGNHTEKYNYADFLIHIGGAGPLGFREVTKTNNTTGETTKKSVTQWDQKTWLPKEITTTVSCGGKTSTIVSKFNIESLKNTYYAYEASSTITDIDGNTAVTETVYDINKGVISEQTVKNDGDEMYKKVTYTGYRNVAGMWVPILMTKTQKHKDDSSPHTDQTRYRYDTKGNVVICLQHYQTPMLLNSLLSYDDLGNCISASTTGTGVNSVVKHYEYDSSGRFVVKAYTVPASTVKTYTYDLWGNVLTETDETDPANKLTTVNTYDNWGGVVSRRTPDGIITTSKTGWGDSDDKKYYIMTQTSDNPWIIRWYDNAGNEVLTQSFGPDKVLISKETNYNEKGLVSRVKQINGKFVDIETFTYDDCGRIQSKKGFSGKLTTYSYGNRTVTTTSSGRSQTQVSDAWGNIVSSTDASGGTVNYVYNSNGNPSEVTSNGSTISFLYDNAGNKIAMSDPDSGTTTYEYAADGTLLKQTDAKGVETVNTYDALGRIVKVKIGDYTIDNVYGTSGNEALMLTKQSMGSNSIEYTHDKYGRVVSEKRNISGNEILNFSYQYDSKNRLSKIVFPGGLDVTYQYDDYGFKIGAKAAGKQICKLIEHYGLSSSKTSFADSIVSTISLDNFGFMSNHSLKLGDRTLDNLNLEFDQNTGNLLSREREGYREEYFEYDDLDRLTTVKQEDYFVPKPRGIGDLPTFNKPKVVTMEIEYSPNGNISSKTGVGSYTYNSSFKPHAVMSVDNTDDIIPSNSLITEFNDFGKVSLIEDESEGTKMDFSYGPDLQRWSTTLTQNGDVKRKTLYAGNYEKITENGITREFYYLDGAAIVVKQNGQFKPYIAFTDHLGSVLSVVDDSGSKVFDATYDSWGQQTVKLNSIGLHRGYTGHEMLNEFGIINMNGRLYDPVLGRFFSPDNFVQLPDFTQSFNRYSYCFNNPMKYTDPSGEFIELVAFALFNAASNMMSAAFNGQNIWKAGAMSLVSSAVSFGIGQAFGGVGSVGKELLRAGAHGVASGILSAVSGGNFGSGFAAGSISAAFGSLARGLNLSPELMMLSSTVSGGLAALTSGGDFLSGALQGLMISFFNDLQHLEVGRRNYKITASGEIYSELQEVTVYYNPKSLLTQAIEIVSGINTIFDCLGNSLEDYSGNSTIGSNGKLYFHSEHERGFHGNQYVKTKKLKDIGIKILRKTKVIGRFFDIYDLYQAGCQGSKFSISNFFSKKFLRTCLKIAGESAGAEMGLQIGSSLGTTIGAHFFGIGAIPGAIIGGFVGSLIGSYICGEIAYNSIDYF